MTEDNKKQPEEAAKKNLKKYTVLKQFTGKELHRLGTGVAFDPDADSTKTLLTHKFIR